MRVRSQVTEVRSHRDLRGYTKVFSDTLLELCENDPSIVALTAAMPGPTGLLPIMHRYPDRVFDVGIAEQHAVASAVAMALAGLRPFVAVYSTFLSRAFDQVNLDAGLHEANVVFCIDRAGITGADGPSHHGSIDLALLLRVPGMKLLAPSSAEELRTMLIHTSTLSGPVALRFPKGEARPRHELGGRCWPETRGVSAPALNCVSSASVRCSRSQRMPPSCSDSEPASTARSGIRGRSRPSTGRCWPTRQSTRAS